MGESEGTNTIPQWLTRALVPLVVIGFVGLGISLRDGVLDHERRLAILERSIASLKETTRNGGEHRSKRDYALERRVSDNELGISNLETRLNYHERLEQGYGNNGWK